MSMRESSKKAAKTTGAWLFLAPSLLGVLVFVMIPFGDALRRSFFDSRGIDFVGLGVYRGVLANQAFRLAAVNTVRFMGTALPLLMAVSFFLESEFNRGRRLCELCASVQFGSVGCSQGFSWGNQFGG